MIKLSGESTYIRKPALVAFAAMLLTTQLPQPVRVESGSEKIPEPQSGRIENLLGCASHTAMQQESAIVSEGDCQRRVLIVMCRTTRDKTFPTSAEETFQIAENRGVAGWNSAKRGCR